MLNNQVLAKAKGKSSTPPLPVMQMTSPPLTAKAARQVVREVSPKNALPVSTPSLRKRGKVATTRQTESIARMSPQSFTDPANLFSLPSTGVPDQPFTERGDHSPIDNHAGDSIFALTPSNGKGGQLINDHHDDPAAPSVPLNITGHFSRDSQYPNASDAPLREQDHKQVVTPEAVVELAPHHLLTIDAIREQWKRRQAWHRAEKSLTLAARAMCRRLVAKGDEKAELKEADKLYDAALNGKTEHPLAEVALMAMIPLIQGRDGIEKYRKAVEKRLAKMAATLPVAPYIDELRGVGIGSLAAIVGEAGNLGLYANPAKLWKRMGMAVMPDGRQRKHADKLLAIAHGYNPSRRSVMWNIGDCIVKAGGPLREIYDARKVTEHAKAKAEGLTVCPANKIPEKDKAKYRSEGHIHNRCKRYVEKRVLLLLWRAWLRLV